VKCPTKYCSLGFGGAAGDREFGGDRLSPRRFAKSIAPLLYFHQ